MQKFDAVKLYKETLEKARQKRGSLGGRKSLIRKERLKEKNPEKSEKSAKTGSSGSSVRIKKERLESDGYRIKKEVREMKDRLLKRENAMNRKHEAEPEFLHDDSWKLFRCYPTPMEASLAAGILENEQIPTYCLNSFINLYAGGRGESKLFIRVCDMDEAERILEKLETSEKLTEEELEAEAMKYDAPE